MATDTRKVVLGTLLLVASSAIILATGQLGSGLPGWAAALAALGMAAGALFVGTSEDARPV
jgi:heme/copper-type cytochrome/quinol oxidase subunit 3